jgi:hypothetical protein
MEMPMASWRAGTETTSLGRAYKTLIYTGGRKVNDIHNKLTFNLDACRHKIMLSSDEIATLSLYTGGKGISWPPQIAKICLIMSGFPEIIIFHWELCNEKEQYVFIIMKKLDIITITLVHENAMSVI